MIHNISVRLYHISFKTTTVKQSASSSTSSYDLDHLLKIII